MGTTGAEEDVLASATRALLDVHDELDGVLGSARRAFGAVRGAAPSPRAREACRRAEDALGPVLRLLSETALQLSADADEQQQQFDAADAVR